MQGLKPGATSETYIRNIGSINEALSSWEIKN